MKSVTGSMFPLGPNPAFLNSFPEDSPEDKDFVFIVGTNRYQIKKKYARNSPLINSLVEEGNIPSMKLPFVIADSVYSKLVEYLEGKAVSIELNEVSSMLKLAKKLELGEVIDLFRSQDDLPMRLFAKEALFIPITENEIQEIKSRDFFKIPEGFIIPVIQSMEDDSIINRFLDVQGIEEYKRFGSIDEKSEQEVEFENKTGGAYDNYINVYPTDCRKIVEQEDIDLLSYAAIYDIYSLMEVLISDGKYSEEDLQRAMMYTASYESYHCAKLLLRPDPEFLKSACTCFSNKIVQMYIRMDKTLNQEAFNSACVEDNAVAVQLLLSVDPSYATIKNAKGDYPIHVCAAWNSVNALRVLLLSGHVNVNSTNAKGQTALHIASKNSSPKVLKLLLQHPMIDVRKRDKSGKFAMNICSCSKNSKVLQLLPLLL